MATKQIYSDTQVVASLTDTGGAVWHSSVITYNFPVSIARSAYESYGFSHATANQQSMTDYWMHAWDDVIGASVVRVADSSKANITVANSSAPSYAYAYYPSSYGAGVYLNPAYGNNSGTNNLVNPVLGDWGAMSIGHELGHALGLSHPGAYDGGSPTYEANAEYMQDSQQYTIMSYFTAAKTGSDWIASDNKMHYAQTPMMNDIMALQSLYGADKSTRATDTAYGFHSTLASSVFDFSVNTHPVVCIYDAGGIDTIDLSGYSASSRISLVAGTFSDCDAMTNNISIARGVTIENALGGGGNDTLIGNDANNVLNGGGGADTLSGGLGGDTYIVDNNLDKVIEQLNQGIDTVVASISCALATNVENLTLTGTAAINGTGNELNNIIVGNGGNNILDGGAGADILSGGLGSDTYIVDNNLDKVVELSNQGIDGVLASVSYALAANAENLTLTGTAAINGTGNELNNIIIGNGGNNILDGGSGADAMTGGLGNDTYIVDSTLDTVIEQANQGSDTVCVSFAYALGANVENLTLTGAAAINGTGNVLNNNLIGNGANNVLDGGAGADTMAGGLGDDAYIVESNLDKVIELLSQGTDKVFASVGYVLAANVENLTLTGTAAINGTGNELNNILVGNGANNTLAGGSGNDILIGGGGLDKLSGGAGLDIFKFLAPADSAAGVNRDVILDFSMLQGDKIDLSQLDGSSQILHWADTGFAGHAGDVCLKADILMCDINGDARADFEVQLIGVTQLPHDFVML